MILDWVSFLAYPNIFGIKGFVVIVVLQITQLEIKRSVN
jgi:type II restriction/modification system DNA methylase subunit YeeA